MVGESGSGKSSLARVVAGLLPRRTGDVGSPGKSLAPVMGNRPRDELRRMQMVHQMPDMALNPRQTLQRDHRPADDAVLQPGGSAK